jgi:hypothetical protein
MIGGKSGVEKLLAGKLAKMPWCKPNGKTIDGNYR